MEQAVRIRRAVDSWRDIAERLENQQSEYHIVFAPKFRRQAIYGKVREDIGKILRQLYELRNVELIEGELCRDHVHLPVSILLSLSVSQFVGYLKGKSLLMIFDRHANLKYKYGNRHF